VFGQCLSKSGSRSFVEEVQIRDRSGLSGINPSIPISEAARRYLARENAEHYLKQAPESLNEKDLDEYDLIITMEPRHKDAVLSKCPECENKIGVWNIDDPYFLPRGYTEKIFKQIKEKVAELANSL